MPNTKLKPDGSTTRESVLKAAVAEFLSKPYDKATLRKIAQRAGVDVAYVHRLFGSKQALFNEVLYSVFERMEQDLRKEGDFLENLLAMGRDVDLEKMFDGVDPIDLFIHSLGNTEARSMMTDFLISHFIEPVAASIGGEDSRTAAEQLYAFFIGYRILRRCVGGPAEERFAPLAVDARTIRLLSDLGKG